MSLQPLTVLRRARKLIADPKAWIQNAFTLKRGGVQCYCGLGAIAHASGVKIIGKQNLSDLQALPDEYYAAHAFLNKAAAANGAPSFGFFASYNDRPGVTHADILRAFDKAIEIAKDKTKKV